MCQLCPIRLIFEVKSTHLLFIIGLFQWIGKLGLLQLLDSALRLSAKK